MIRFYAPDAADTGRLPESDSGHAIRVLRLHAGDELQTVDGRGHVLTCRLADENADEPPVWTGSLTVMVAPTKQMERMEWMLEKLVEIGIDRFVPVRCARSERKEIKTERLTRIAVSAMKQSLKATLPVIDNMTPLAKAVATLGDGCQKFVGYCDEAVERRLLARTLQPCRDTAILIGPEGDFTPDEIKMLIDSGFIPVTMGDNRLRTETASIVGADTFHIVAQLGDIIV